MADVERKINLRAGDSSALPLIEKANAALTRQATGVEKMAVLYAEDTRRFEQSIKRQVTGMEMLAQIRSRDTQRFESDVNDRIRALNLEESQIARVGGAYDRSAPEKTVRGVGGSTALSTIGELFGGTQVGQIANTIGDVTRLAEQLPRLDGGFAGLLTTVGPLAIGAGIVGAGFVTLTNQLAEGAKEVERNVDALLVRRNTERIVRDEMLTTDEVQKRLADARQREADALADKTVLEGVDDAAFADSQKNISDLGARVGTALVSLGGGFNSINEAINAADKEVRSARAEINGLTSALDSGATSVGDMAAAQKLYTDQLTASGDVIRRLFEQERDLRMARGQTLDDRSIDKQIADARAKITADNKAADEADDLLFQQQQSFAAHQTRMTQIQAAGNAKIESLRQSAIDRETQIAGQIAELTAASNATRAKVDDAFRRETERKEREHRRDLMRLTEDANTNILSAIRKGDFAAAKELEQKRDLDRSRLIEDFNTARDERAEDVRLQIEESEKTTQARIAQLQAELLVFKANVATRIGNEERLLEASLAAAQTEYENRLELDQRLRDVQKAREERDRTLREQWAQEDADLRNAREERAFNAQIQRIDDLEAAEFERIKAARTGVEEIQAAQAVADAAHLAAISQIQAGIASIAGLFPSAGPVLTPPYGAGLIGSALPPTFAGALPLPAPPDPFGIGGFFGASSAQPLAGSSMTPAESRYSLQLSTAGMFEGAVIGDVISSEEVGTLIAAAQYEVGLGMRELFSRLTQGNPR